MEDYTFLFVLSLILLSTKMFGIASARVHMPQVVGALVAGIILGPSCLGILKSTEFIKNTAEIGVIMLMFSAGIDTDIEELKKSGFRAFIVATLGVIVPLLLCGSLYFLYFCNGVFTLENVLRSCFVGSVFSATSVSITVETLNEMGKLKTHTGTTLLSAALIDDIMGIIVLSILTGLSSGITGNANQSTSTLTSVLIVLGKIIAFFVFVGICAVVFRWIFQKLEEKFWQNRRVAIYALALCFLMSFCAEYFFGIADITGAYFAGLILCNLTKARQYIAKKITVTSYMLFTPVFFASIGMRTNLKTMTSSIAVFAIILVLFAIISKIIGCGLGAKATGMTKQQSLIVGVGMIARSEVALMVAQKGIDAGMINPDILPAIILSVICSALITPILLKVCISKNNRIIDL